MLFKAAKGTFDELDRLKTAEAPHFRRGQDHDLYRLGEPKNGTRKPVGPVHLYHDLAGADEFSDS
ncbi:MAG: hypothetical protein U1D30_24500 [Planctomycetota bacterium]